jgi:spore coat protein CotF
MQNTNQTPGQSGSCMGEKEYLNDSIAVQKLICSSYNTYATECTNVNLKNDLLSILQDEQQIQFDLFNVANQKGWYQVEQADQQKITQAKQKFSNMGG